MGNGSLSTFGVLIALLVVGLLAYGCGDKKKSDRSGVTSSGSGTNTGTGTSTGTGSGSGTGNPGSAVALDMIFATDWDATQSWLEAKVNEIATSYAEGIWKASEGQIYLKSATMINLGLTDIDVGYSDGPDARTLTSIPGAPGYCRTNASGYMIVLAGGTSRSVFMHEFGHGEFRIKGEEYDCTACLMQRGDGAHALQYCDTNNCLDSTRKSEGACWDGFILQKYTGWTHTGANPGATPACQTTINP